MKMILFPSDYFDINKVDESFKNEYEVVCGDGNFEILLFGYSVNDGSVQVVDLARGEKIPDDILQALSDENVTKWAFNAMFERICLSVYLRRNYPQYFSSYSVDEDTVGDYLDPHGWKCSMTWAAYMGLPLSLKSVGEVLKLTEQKMDEGKALISYFSIPCAPTASNGGRTRNLPKHDISKWLLFKEYNKRDVERRRTRRGKTRSPRFD